MKEVVKSLTGPDRKVYSATFHVPETNDEIVEAANRMGLTLAQVAFGLRIAKKQVYLDSLDSTVDTKISAAVAALVAIGVSAEEAQGIAEAQRSAMGNSLPEGLVDTGKQSKRGRPKSESAEPEAN